MSKKKKKDKDKKSGKGTKSSGYPGSTSVISIYSSMPQDVIKRKK